MFQVTRRSCVFTSEASALPASAAATGYINPQRRTAPEALTKFAKRKNRSPAALPSLYPIHYWGFRGDTSLARQAAQEKVRPRIMCACGAALFSLIYHQCAHNFLKVCFLFRSVQHAGYSVCSPPHAEIKHETSIIHPRYTIPVHILRSKCICDAQSACVQLPASHQFLQPCFQLRNRHFGSPQNQEEALY